MHRHARSRVGAALTPLCPPFYRPPFAALQMAAPQQQGFTANIFSEGRDFFPISVAGASVSAVMLKSAVESSASGKEMGFATASWGLFLADADGNKQGLEQKGRTPIAPAAGATEVDLWVERVVAPAAGEPWGPGSWAGGGLGAGLG